MWALLMVMMSSSQFATTFSTESISGFSRQSECDKAIIVLKKEIKFEGVKFSYTCVQMGVPTGFLYGLGGDISKALSSKKSTTTKKGE